jgi:hypothetical protein
MFYKKDLIFQFYSPTRILFGEGECKKIGQEALKLGAKRIAVIVDQGIKDSEMVKTVIHALGGLCVGIFDEIVPDSGIDLINRGGLLPSGSRRCSCFNWRRVHDRYSKGDWSLDQKRGEGYSRILGHDENQGTGPSTYCYSYNCWNR